MIPRLGDVIESNHLGCNRYRVINADRCPDGIHLFCHVIYPPDDQHHPRKVESWWNGLREEGDLIVGRWHTPEMAYYSALRGHDDTSPRRIEFMVIERAHYEQQLDLFGQVA